MHTGNDNFETTRLRLAGGASHLLQIGFANGSNSPPASGRIPIIPPALWHRSDWSRPGVHERETNRKKELRSCMLWPAKSFAPTRSRPMTFRTTPQIED